VRVVVADTGPLHYLVWIGQIDLVSKLFEKVFLPTEVRDELSHEEAPEAVPAWIGNPPAWLTVMPAPIAPADPALLRLDDGERAAIALAVSLSVDAILMDDRAGVAAARSMGFPVMGTLGILDAAAGKISLTCVRRWRGSARRIFAVGKRFSRRCSRGTRPKRAPVDSTTGML
jgi:predicted nucleic acid-binding protein